MTSSMPHGSARRPVGAAEAVRVLLISDHAPVRLTLEAVLTKSGYSVDSAVSAADGMERIEAEVYDLVLCDLSRDGESIERVLRVARAQPYRPATGALRVSGREDYQAPRDGKLLVTPVDVARLLTQVTELSANRAYARAARRKTA